MKTLDILASRCEQINDFQLETVLTIKTPLPDPDTIEFEVSESLRLGEIDCDGFDPYVDVVKIQQQADDYLIADVHIISISEDAP